MRAKTHVKESRSFRDMLNDRKGKEMGMGEGKKGKPTLATPFKNFGHLI